MFNIHHSPSLILLIASVPLLFFKSRHSNISIILFLYSGIIIILNILRDNAIGDNVLLFLPMLIGFLIATRIPINTGIKCFCNLIYALTIYALILYFACLILPSLAYALPYLGNVYDSSATIHNGLFSVVISGSAIPRNYGITWEPGAFAVLLCIATYCTLNAHDNISKRRLIVFTLGIITTFSTMGFIVLMLLFISKLNFHKQHNVGLVLIFLFMMFMVLQIPFLQELVFGKLSGIGNASEGLSETTEARLNAVVYPGLAFLNNPIWGVGYDTFKTINTTFCDNVATNTIINWFAIFGILIGAPFLFYYLRAAFNIFDGKPSIMSISTIVIGAILLVSTESLLRISLMYVIVFIGTLNSIKNKQING